MKQSKNAVALPWSERHRPRHLGQVVGNTEQVRKLAEWLRDWDDVVLHGKTKAPPEPDPKKDWKQWRPAPENLNARAALISGPPGIGKTTTSVLVAKCNPKYSCKEFNASDARSKKIVDEMSKSLAGNMTLKFGSDSTKSALERSVIIMDECDGMAGGDAGGMQALMNMIKITKNPIICICNDRQDQAVRSLAGVCLDIKFKRPDNAVVAKRMKAILESEGHRADGPALEAIVEAAGNDIRQVLNQVQFFGPAVARAQGSQKDTQVQSNPWDACTKLLSKEESGSKPTPLPTKLDLFYIDPDMVPLLVQENYLRPYEKSNRTLQAEDISTCAYAAEMIATADSMQGDWGLQSSVAAIGTIYPSFLTSANGPPLRPSFPAWLMKRSNMTKNVRLSQEMYSHIKPFTTCSRKDLMTNGYLDLMYRRLLRPLGAGDAKGCAAMLHRYGLTREFFTEQAPALRNPLNLDDPYKRIDGKNRIALLSELQELGRSAPKKRVVQDSNNPWATRKKARGDAEGAAGDDAAKGDAAEPDEDDLGDLVMKTKSLEAEKKKRKAMVTKDMSKCSLQGWVKKEVKLDANGEVVVRRERKKGLLLKFIEGHTNAVRRQVHFEDIINPWRQF